MSRRTLGIVSASELYISVNDAREGLRAVPCGYAADIKVVGEWIA
jgi:hypothetical protein